MAASELTSARGKRSGSAKRSTFRLLAVAAIYGVMQGAAGVAYANVINTDGTCVTGSSGIVGRVNPGSTSGATGAPTQDGTGTYSLVAGCNATGTGSTAVTVYGAFAQGRATGASAFGFLSNASGKWSSAYGLESNAGGISSIAMGFGSNAAALNSVAIGGAGGDGTTPLTVANSTTASGSGAVAIGSNATKGAQATATDSIAIGGQALSVPGLLRA